MCAVSENLVRTSTRWRSRQRYLVTVACALLWLALPFGVSYAAAFRGKPASKAPAKAAVRTATAVKACKAAPAAKIPASPATNEAGKPAPDDPEHDRIARLQEALDGEVHGPVLGRLRVGMRVESLASGRTLYGWRSQTLMDPASNQKVLATSAALLRLGNSFRFRTEVTGAAPDFDGTSAGDLVIRGDGDPSLRMRHIEQMAAALARRGLVRVKGAVLGDPRRIGCDENEVAGRSPLAIGGAAVDVRVRPGERPGSRPLVSLYPASESFVVVNQAETRAKGKTRIEVSLERAGNRYSVMVKGRIAKGEVTLHRVPPGHALYAAILLRNALVQAGVTVEGGAGIVGGQRQPRLAALEGAMMALSKAGDDGSQVLAAREGQTGSELLAVRESAPLPLLLRRVNKDSDNEWAERVLEAAGGEIYGGAATTAKGVRVLREAISELGLSTTMFVPTNGSGLGHQNRVTAAGMAELLRRLYLDPRIGPDIAQSLSVGGVDGTTRNRFRGSPASHRVRAKTGTLNGVSCLSGYVGDGDDVLVFSILVEGHKHSAVARVRAAQVAAVSAMMRFARGSVAAPTMDDASTVGRDFESDGEPDESEGESVSTPTETAE